MLDDRAHQLVETIYAATVDSDHWQEVVDQLSVIFHGSPVVVGQIAPNDPRQDARRFAAGVDPDLGAEFLQRLVLETPWSNRQLARFADGFREMGHLGSIELDRLDLYRDWLKPLGIAPFWPVGHAIHDAQGRPVGGVTIFRKEGQGPFTEEELEYANQFVPHLARAIQIEQSLRDTRSTRAALGEALDRLPTGVLLLDSGRRVVLRNRCAKRILSEEDGLRVDASGPSALDAKENARLQALIAEALDPNIEQLRGGGFASVTRPSGRRDYTLLVARLAEAPARSVSSDAVVMIFVVDPESGYTTPAEVLEDLYELTHSEAQIVRLIAQGMSLEEAAQTRGVSMNTARSHLKHAFAKTGTGRQSELLRLVIAGVGAIGDGADRRSAAR